MQGHEDWQKGAVMEPWNELDAVRAELLEMLPAVQGEVSPAAHVLGVLQLGEGSVVLPGTVIEGHVRIGKGCRIGPNAYLRGETSIGDGCVVGNAVEVKSSVLGNQVFVSHLSYIGDSILRDDVNVGGGCIFSNFRHDAGEIRMPWQGKLRATGRNKLGCVVGSGCRIGCKCVVLPGRVLEPGTWTTPGSVIR